MTDSLLNINRKITEATQWLFGRLEQQPEAEKQKQAKNILPKSRVSEKLENNTDMYHKAQVTPPS